MRKIVLMAICLVILWAESAQSAPECYTKAQYPAHEFPFVKDREYFEAVSIDPSDGNKCLSPILIYKGEPLLRQPLYAPLGNAYASYIKGMGDPAAMRKLVAFLKPTPRDLSGWVFLSNEPETPPREMGGMKGMKKLFDFLKPDIPFMEMYQSSEILKINEAWPLLFLLMGGEVIPGGKPARDRHRDPYWLADALKWRFPAYVLDVDEDTGRLILK